MESKLAELRAHLREIDDIASTISVLRWDQSTYMPTGGARGRARQIATLGRLAHARRIEPRLGELLEDLEPWSKTLPEGDINRDLIRVAKHNYSRDSNVPSEFIERMFKNGSASFHAWMRARPADDFSMVQPYLERTVELSRELSSFYGPHEHVADPLIESSDTGMTAQSLRALFAELRAELTPLVEAICDRPEPETAFLHQQYDGDSQLKFGLRIAEEMGFDLEKGRLDLTHHPFMTKFSLGDVRITTNIRDNDVSDTLFSTLHETGHALYELGFSDELEGTPLAEGTSAGVHESQSRLWENIVGRSRLFWGHYFPRIQATFPKQLDDVNAEQFYRAINRVRRSVVRTESDEVTYNLHVIIRFDLELALLEGDLTVADLPMAWRERYIKDLGIDPGNDKNGVLQDVHWYDGQVGGLFQGYTIGNILSAQFYDAAVAAHPEIPTQIGRAQFKTLREWLRREVHQYGSRYQAPDLVKKATGAPIGIGPYMRYLRTKYTELYNL